MSKREKRKEWEAEYVSEYIQKFWPKRLYILHFRITGPPSPLLKEELEPEETRMLKVYARWADAIIMVPPTLYIVEAKLKVSDYLKALGEILYYREAIYRNSEINWKEFKVVVGIIVVPIEDPIFTNIARRYGIRVDIYKPSFWQEFLKAQPVRFVSPKRT
jgi:hypothetical protein